MIPSITGQKSDVSDKLRGFLGKERVQKQKDITPYLTLHNQASAQYFFQAESKNDLINAVKASRALGLSLLIMGGGSNLVVFRKDLTGLVVRNQFINKQVLVEDKTHVELSVSSGYPVTRLVLETVVCGWEGFEYHLGLPGTVGGALYMNSKWTKPVSYFGDQLLRAEIINLQGKIRQVDRSYFRFAYDYSFLQKTKELVLEAIFCLKKIDPFVLKKRSEEAAQYRRQTQPMGVATCGCFFKNISEIDRLRLGLATTSAGYLIDKAGLKGKVVGDFMVSPKHANFIINRGQGKSKDLLLLLQEIKSRVKEKYQVDLQEEVIIV